MFTIIYNGPGSALGTMDVISEQNESLCLQREDIHCGDGGGWGESREADKIININNTNKYMAYWK